MLAYYWLEKITGNDTVLPQKETKLTNTRMQNSFHYKYKCHKIAFIIKVLKSIK